MAEHDADREPQPIDEDAAWAAIVAGYGEEPADPPGAKPFKSVEDLALLEGDRNRTGTGKVPAVEKPAEKAAEKAPAKPPEKPAEQPAESGPGKTAEKAAGPVGPADAVDGAPDGERAADSPADGGGKPALGGSVVFAPGVGGGGPRDYRLAEPSEENFEAGDEGHFVPPEPPPLPESDVTSRFAWLAVLGGPVLMLVCVLLQWEMTWWLTTISVGGFLGGFATLVARMKDDDEESDDPGRGAVV
ncbi:hypothetical protein [Streptomyces paludis]|uniref:DUF308 domain-containing protein n=1 Tax=Streptomyces paludis TaxID=2282738 RepID=A0A345HL35_9ACTN|nr:hypothetical protein [Streptomyces paludis]AXG77409.1 hypothetical protein DVK44_06555 [Streptomyces paludis]